MLCINHIIFIDEITDIQETPHLKIKIQKFFSKFSIPKFLQIVFRFTHHRKQCQRKIPNGRKNPAGLTFPFPLKHQPVTPLQCFFQLFPVWLHQLFHSQDILLVQNRTVHLPTPFHQIVSLIDQKYVISFNTFRKKTAKIYLWIKHIIIITDHSIHPDGEIQTHLIRADLIPFRIRKQHLPVINFLFLQKFKHRIIYPVKMSLCPCTGCRITLHAVTHTQFFFCNQKQRLPAKSMLFQDFKSFPCNRTGNRFCSQIKDSF